MPKQSAESLFAKAAAKLIGREIPRDLRSARVFLEKASRLRHERAALLDVALTANGTGSAASWPDAITKLKAMASWSAVAHRHVELLGRMRLDDEGLPTELPAHLPLSQSPAIGLMRGLLTVQECMHIAQAADDLLRPASVIDPTSGQSIAHPVRRSDAAVLGPMREDLVLGAINRRLASATKTRRQQGEPLAVLRYRRGQEYRTHHDALPGEANQRFMTVIVYLNDGYTGGETSFPTASLNVRGAAGDALVFRNLTADDAPDPATIHAGRPVLQGTKMIATRWIRKRPLDVWR